MTPIHFVDVDMTNATGMLLDQCTVRQLLFHSVVCIEHSLHSRAANLFDEIHRLVQ